MSTSSKRAIVVIIVIALSLGGLLAFRFYQGRQNGSAEAAGPQAGGIPSGQWQGGSQNQQRGNNPAGGGPPGGGFGGGNFGTNRPPLVEVGMATEGVVRERLALVGALRPKQQVEVVPKITGRIQRLLVDVGDSVTEGQLLAELEGEEYEQQVLRAEATLAVANATISQRQAELANAKADQARGTQLFSEGLVSVQSQDSLETRVRVVESQLALAQAQVRQAQADLAELKIRQQQTKILAPLNGWIGRRYVDPGAMVNTNSPIVNVLYLDSMITEVKVPEDHLGNLKVGNRALVSIDAFGGQTFEGRVARIAPVLDAATRSGSVQVEIANPGGRLKAEMSARIQMEMGSEHRSVVVPRDAVVMRGQQTGVNVLEGDRVRFQQIETGISTDLGVEVVSGLKTGTTIITRGSQGLQDGARVEVQKNNAASVPVEDRS
ncbi:MAG: efflux RND transporter periplasmic adaptor subunit [Acidobacteria bacterium]|nr:efflux RND transporter periplasmic adaptor subunit [Acidobacteriota bacterium]